jgi:hypothetical protein
VSNNCECFVNRLRHEARKFAEAFSALPLPSEVLI